MNRQKKRTITLLMTGISILLIGTLIGYLLTNSSYSSELDHQSEQIESLKQAIAEQEKENADLQADILEAKKTITELEEQAAKDESNSNEESKDMANQTDNETAKENVSADSSTEKGDSSSDTKEQIEQTDTNHHSDKVISSSDEVTSTESTDAINLVKEHVGYANESNVHFDIEGNVPGSSDICIHVYEVVDDGESQHTATWGWYGVNVNSKSVYDTEGL
ncbi:hypothetical protein [Pradoshia sp.]